MSDDVIRAATFPHPPSSEDGVDPGAAPPDTAAQRADARSLNPSDSPCVAVCSTLYDDICRGCGRTALEVANWVVFDESEKRLIWERITAQGYPRRNR